MPNDKFDYYLLKLKEFENLLPSDKPIHILECLNENTHQQQNERPRVVEEEGNVKQLNILPTEEQQNLPSQFYLLKLQLVQLQH